MAELAKQGNVEHIFAAFVILIRDLFCRAPEPSWFLDQWSYLSVGLALTKGRASRTAARELNL